jgi:hypothetical protein
VFLAKKKFMQCVTRVGAKEDGLKYGLLAASWIFKKMIVIILAPKKPPCLPLHKHLTVVVC